MYVCERVFNCEGGAPKRFCLALKRFDRDMTWLSLKLESGEMVMTNSFSLLKGVPNGDTCPAMASLLMELTMLTDEREGRYEGWLKTSYMSYLLRDWMLWKILVKDCLHRGHTAFRFDHSTRHPKQNMWKHLSVNDLLLILLKQMEHFESGDGAFSRSSIISAISMPAIII